MTKTDSEKALIGFFGKKKGKDPQSILIEGKRAIIEAMEAKAELQSVFYVPVQFDNPLGENFLKRLNEKTRLTPIRRKELEKLVSTIHSQGIVAIARKPVWDLNVILSRHERLIVALDGIADPGNLGTIIRTCAWFGVAAILIGQGCVSVFNEKVIRSTVGGIFRIPCIEQVDLAPLLSILREKGYLALALHTEGENLLEMDLERKKIVYVIGNEANGIRKEIMDATETTVTIPRFGTGESLNAAIAAGIALSMTQRKTKR